MKIIDTHCHLDFAAFDADREAIIEHCKQLGVSQIILPAVDSEGWDKLISLTDRYENLYPALGLHPVFIDKHQESDLDLLEEKVTKYHPLAIGEIGLDFFIKNTDREKQINFFSRQLDIAASHHLPVILHIRKAHDEVLKILQKKNITGGSCHAFNGTLEQAKKYMEMGFKFGFGGTLTYPNARKIHQLAKELPLESIILETDAPDMTGFNHKGERNSPEYLPEALEALVNIRQEDIETIVRQTTENARELFRF